MGTEPLRLFKTRCLVHSGLSYTMKFVCYRVMVWCWIATILCKHLREARYARKFIILVGFRCVVIIILWNKVHILKLHIDIKA